MSVYQNDRTEKVEVQKNTLGEKMSFLTLYNFMMLVLLINNTCIFFYIINLYTYIALYHFLSSDNVHS